MGRSALAVASGFFFVVAAHMAVWMGLGFANPEALPGPREDDVPGPPTESLALLTLLTLPCGLLGGYVTGVVAERAEVRHGLMTALLVGSLLALSVLVPLEGQVPAWFLVGLPVVGLAATVLGSWLRALQKGKPPW
jgi:hypothetical protein